MSNYQKADIWTAVGEAVLRSIMDRYGHLAMTFEASESGPFEFDVQIPEQEGLAFAVTLAHADDTMYIGASRYWMEYFPIDRRPCVEGYEVHVNGLLSGQYRVVEHYRHSQLVDAALQRPDRDGWKTVGTMHYALRLPFLHYDRRVLHNGHQGADV